MSNKKIIYLQGADLEYLLPKAVEQAFELKIEPDDQLAISVASKDRELIEPFNNNTLIGGGNNGNYSSSTTNTTSGGLNRRGIGQGAVLDSPREITILPYLPR